MVIGMKMKVAEVKVLMVDAHLCPTIGLSFSVNSLLARVM